MSTVQGAPITEFHKILKTKRFKIQKENFEESAYEWDFACQIWLLTKLDLDPK